MWKCEWIAVHIKVRLFVFIATYNSVKYNLKSTTMDKKIYETPQVEIMEVAIEKGFATSGGDTIDDMPYFDGGWQ